MARTCDAQYTTAADNRTLTCGRDDQHTLHEDTTTGTRFARIPDSTATVILRGCPGVHAGGESHP